MKVTFDDKVGITPRRIRINQVQDRDLNEIKNAINTNYDEFVDELVIKRVVYVTLSEIGITASSYTVGQLETAVTIYRNTLPDIVDNRKAVYDILLTENNVGYNRIQFNTGTAPSILQLQTALGITLTNPLKTGDVITFENKNYNIPNAAFSSNTNLLSFVVEKGVTAGNDCFSDCTSLVSGFENLVSAGDRCFDGCVSLNAEFDELTTAGERCFAGCSDLDYNFIKLTTADNECFINCSSLTGGFIVLTTAGDNCFENCVSLVNGFTLLNSVGGECFKGCILLNANFNNLTYANNSCFYECTALNGTFNSLTSAGIASFYNCTSLNKNFNLLTTASNLCFYGCSALNGTFDNLITAGNGCFEDCVSLVGSFPDLKTIGSTCFSNCILLNYNFSNLRIIGNYGFYNCDSLSVLNFAEVRNFGTNSSFNNVFTGITGKTMNINVRMEHMNSNAGSLEGDLDYLNTNNTVTFNWI